MGERAYGWPGGLVLETWSRQLALEIAPLADLAGVAGLVGLAGLVGI